MPTAREVHESIEQGIHAIAAAEGITFGEAATRLFTEKPSLYPLYNRCLSEDKTRKLPPEPEKQLVRETHWAERQLVELAAKKRAATSGMTEADAMVMACSERPDLYAAYSRKQSRGLLKFVEADDDDFFE